MSGLDAGTIRGAAQAWLLSRAPEALEIPSRWERRVRIREAVARFLADRQIPLPEQEVARLVRDLSDSISGLGPLEPLLRDPGVTEVMVNGPDRIYVERDGKLERTAVRLDGEAGVRHLIDRIVAPLGLRVDETAPWADARLPDGSRVHAIIPPIAVTGATLTIRRFPGRPLSEADLLASGALARKAADLLREAVRARRNLIVSGGTGAGKTTLLNVLSAAIPEGERIVTIEDAAELRLAQEHVVSLEARPPSVEGRGEVTIRELVRNALRMRPDRIVVGEVRGPEAFDMLQAMNTGHAGSMSTCHANATRDLLARLEAMVLMGAAISVEAAQRQIASGLDLVVHVARAPGGRRVVTEIAEVRAADGSLDLVDLYRCEGEPGAAGPAAGGPRNHPGRGNGRRPGDRRPADGAPGDRRSADGAPGDRRGGERPARDRPDQTGGRSSGRAAGSSGGRPGGRAAGSTGTRPERRRAARKAVGSRGEATG